MRVCHHQVAALAANIALMVSVAVAVPGDLASERNVLAATGIFALLVPLNSPLLASHLTKLVSPQAQVSSLLLKIG